MKTTVELDDVLPRAAKQRAAKTGIPLRALIEDAPRARLMPRSAPPKKIKLDLPIVVGTAPPAVDIANREALYDLMERD